MHDYKIYAPVTTWPPGIFIGRNGNFSAPIHYQTDILTFETPKQKSWLYFRSEQIGHSMESRISQLQLILSCSILLMCGKYETP